MHYTNLHSHDYYSKLDGLSSPAEYAARAKELGMTHLAQTNHGTNAGHREHQRACKEAGIIPILGQEVYYTTDRFDRRAAKDRDDGSIYNHLTVLATNENGLKNLNSMSSIAWKEGYYFKPRLDFEVLEPHADDIVVLSGCLSGPLAKAIEQDAPNRADSLAREFKAIYGDRFFIEVMAHNPLKINSGLMELSRKHNIPAVVTSDCHHANKQDLWVQEALLILSTNPKIAKDFDFSKSQKMDYIERFNYLYPDRRMSFQEYDLHLNTAAELLAGLEKQGIGPEVITNTKLVADMVGEYPYYEGLDLLPRPENEDDKLRNLVMEGLKAKGLTSKDYMDRLDEELSVITSKNFSVYFLIAHDAVSWARQNGIRVGSGRGSAAGSLVCYALGITNVDPLVHGTLFFRFLSPDRLGFPDADIDFEKARRHEVKEYIRKKYTHVGNIATFGMFKDKGVVRDAARVFRIPLKEVNRALKDVDSYESFLANDETREFRNKYPEVVELANKFRGRIRSGGLHAGGLVIGNQPLSNYVPTETAKDPDNPAGSRIEYVAVDMTEAESIGLIKYDFLGLKTLSVIGDAVRLIESTTGKTIDVENLSLDDHKVYKMLSNGDTLGVFQVEATPYTNLLIQMGGVKDFKELVASNALVRPGAAKSSFGEQYKAGKRGELVKSLHPDVDQYLRDTHYVPLYQEQVMQLCIYLAGMTPAESEHVRKAIGKKKAEELAKWSERFISGASEKIGATRAKALWKDIEASSEYQFNLSHAVAYSMITYQTAWLKRYYPVEFMTAVLRNEEDKDMLLDYLTEVKRMGIRVKLPHVNESGLNFEIREDGKGLYIMFGLSSIKYISDKLGHRIIESRPFEKYQHLLDVATTKGSGISTRVVASLNAVGAAEFEDNPRTGNERENYFEYLNIPAFNTKAIPAKVRAQARPLDEFSGTETFVITGMVRAIKTGEGWARVEVVDETGSAGIFTSPNHGIEAGKMYIMLVSDNRVSRYISVDDIDKPDAKEFMDFLVADGFPDVPPPMLRVVAFNSRKTKAGKRMASVVFSDEHKNLSTALVWPGQFMQCLSKLVPGKVVDVKFGATEDGTKFVNNIL